MRQKFREFYKHTPDEIDAFWNTAIFSFDANILLNLYRYTENTRRDVLETFEYFKNNGRLWISYQAAFEYQKNRLIVKNASKKAYKELIEKLAKKQKEVGAVLNEFKKHQNLNIDNIKELFDKTFKKVEDNLIKLDLEHPDLMDIDPIFDALTDLLDGCIGDAMNEAELISIFKEGKTRYEKEIPPGYKDLKEKKNEPEQSLYGDLIIWKQLIKKIKAATSKLIFVTDDLKEDWWHIFNEKTIGSRAELAREFYAETQNEIIIYKPEQFLKFYKERIREELTEETIKEVEETRKNDEILYTSLPVMPLISRYPNLYVGNQSLIDYFKNRENANPEWIQPSGLNGSVSFPGYLINGYETPGPTGKDFSFIQPGWLNQTDWLKSIVIPGTAGTGSTISVAEPEWLKKYENLANAIHGDTENAAQPRNEQQVKEIKDNMTDVKNKE